MRLEALPLLSFQGELARCIHCDDDDPLHVLRLPPGVVLVDRNSHKIPPSWTPRIVRLLDPLQEMDRTVVWVMEACDPPSSNAQDPCIVRMPGLHPFQTPAHRDVLDALLAGRRHVDTWQGRFTRVSAGTLVDAHGCVVSLEAWVHAHAEAVPENVSLLAAPEAVDGTVWAWDPAIPSFRVCVRLPAPPASPMPPSTPSVTKREVDGSCETVCGTRTGV